MEQKNIKILLIEDSQQDAVLIKEMLQQADGHVDLIHFNSLSESINHLKNNAIDLILLDLGLPQTQGLDTFRILKNETTRIPVIILTALDELSVAVQAVQEGAQDYLVKGEINGDFLRRAVRCTIERKKLKILLQEKEALFRGIFENAYHGIVVVDTQGTIELFNPRMVEMSGYTAEELKSNNVFALTYDEDVAVSRRNFEMILNGRVDHYRLAKRYRRKDGSPFWAEISVRPLHAIDGSIKGAVAIIVNINAFKETEARLLQLQQQQKALLDNIPHIAWMKDKEGRYIAANEPFGKACGFKPEDLIGKTDWDIWPKELAEKYQADDLKIMKSEKREYLEESLVDSEGKKQWVETIKTPIYDKKGEVIGIAGIARDITERHKSEITLQETLEDLKRFKEATIDRELKMIELKKQINELSEQSGQSAPYDLSFLNH